MSLWAVGCNDTSICWWLTLPPGLPIQPLMPAPNTVYIKALRLPILAQHLKIQIVTKIQRPHQVSLSKCQRWYLTSCPVCGIASLCLSITYQFKALTGLFTSYPFHNYIYKRFRPGKQPDLISLLATQYILTDCIESAKNSHTVGWPETSHVWPQDTASTGYPAGAYKLTLPDFSDIKAKFRLDSYSSPWTTAPFDGFNMNRWHIHYLMPCLSVLCSHLLALFHVLQSIHYNWVGTFFTSIDSYMNFIFHSLHMADIKLCINWWGQ